MSASAWPRTSPSISPSASVRPHTESPAKPQAWAGVPGDRLPIVNGTWFLIVFFLKAFVSMFKPWSLPL